MSPVIVILIFLMYGQHSAEASVYETCYQMPDNGTVIEMHRNMACSNESDFSMTTVYDSDLENKFQLKLSCNSFINSVCIATIKRKAAVRAAFRLVLHKKEPLGRDFVTHDSLNCQERLENKVIVLTCDKRRFITSPTDLYKINLRIQLRPDLPVRIASTTDFRKLFTDDDDFNRTRRAVKQEKREVLLTPTVLVLRIVAGILLAVLFGILIAIFVGFYRYESG